MKRISKIWLPLIFAAIFVCGMWLGYMLKGGPNLSDSQRKLLEIFSLIEDEYVDEVDMDSLIELTIPDLLQNLDPHSVYIPKDERDDVNNELSSSMSGIGITFQMIDDTVRVVEVITGGPADKVGIRTGDRIIKVDGQSLIGANLTDKMVRQRLRGDEGTHVNLTVRRLNSSKPLTFDIVRGKIPVTSVDALYLLDDRTGYIKINRFAKDTYDEFISALNKLRYEGAEDFVLDLRGNSGGYMEPSLMMANEFLPASNTIVSTRGRNGLDEVILSDGSGAFVDNGLVVLVDEFTASSSEIFAGAIQDNDRGLIIGRRTFGKGLVQKQIDMNDSSEIRLTIQRYYTPSGRCIQKRYNHGDNFDYNNEIINRINSGESFSADSIKINQNEIYTTVGGRKVYGGGGIMPDVFVPNDTSAITKYYIDVTNAGLINRFAIEYCDLNRDMLSKCKDVESLQKVLPPDYVLLQSFVQYAAQHGIPARWYYINISTPLIVNQLKAWIARDMLGTSAFYEIYNTRDNAINEALERLHTDKDPINYKGTK